MKIHSLCKEENLVLPLNLPQECLRMELMELGHRILSPLLCILLAGCSAHVGPQDTVDERANPLARDVTLQNWSAILKSTATSTTEISQLLNDYALFQMGKFAELVARPLQSKDLFFPYRIYLRTLAYSELKQHAQVVEMERVEDLPRRLNSRLELTKAASLVELKRLEDARKLLIRFVADPRSNGQRGEGILLLADVEWGLGFKDESIKRYRMLYETFPLVDRENQALNRLQSEGVWGNLDTEVHLSRIQKLQRAAQFRKASQELESLLKTATPEQSERIRLAQANLSFAMREYTKTTALARSTLKRKIDADLQLEWKNLLGWSLIRNGKPEEGLEVYQEILKANPPERLRESLLFRIGSTAIDEDQFELASTTFANLRKDFPRGRYVESSHWFESWALLQKALAQKPLDAQGLRASLELLEKLPKLPEGARLEAQALYWQSQIHRLLDEKELMHKATYDLESRWRFSFYQLLAQNSPFKFLEENDVRDDRLSMNYRARAYSPTFENSKAWKRLEAFRKLHLMEWARLEMDEFINQARRGSAEDKLLIAHRLEDLGDYADQVRWTEQNVQKSLEGLDEDAQIMQLLYPQAYKDHVLKAARDFRLSPFLVWGLMREESRFEVEARSHAGAEGLMQLMPDLSRRIGRALGENRPQAGWMFDARRNIRFGTYHLAELKAQVKDFPVPNDLKPVLIVAAYNAGIDPVRKWVREQDTSKVDTFVESIPYTETRNYVKRVLQSGYIYSRLYGSPAKKTASEISKAEKSL